MSGVRWTKREIEVLKKVYPKYLLGEISKEDLLKLFPHRSFSAIQWRADYLDLNKIKKPLVNESFYKELKKKVKL